MDWYKAAEHLFIKFAPSMVGFLMEQKLSFVIIFMAAVTFVLVHNHLSENQYGRVRNNPKNAIATIYLLALIILLLFFCLGALYTPPSHEDKINEKTTEQSSSTGIQSVNEKNQQYIAWIDKLIDNLNDKEDQKKIMDLYEKVLSLTQDNERCSGQLKYCSDQLAAKQ